MSGFYFVFLEPKVFPTISKGNSRSAIQKNRTWITYMLLWDLEPLQE